MGVSVAVAVLGTHKPTFGLEPLSTLTHRGDPAGLGVTTGATNVLPLLSIRDIFPLFLLSYIIVR